MIFMLQIVTGFVCGYFFATIFESALHRWFGHARSAGRRRWKRFPGISSVLSAVYYSHAVIHHGKTFRANHVTQFRNMDEKARLDEELFANGNRGVIHVCYGLITNVEGAIYFVVIPFIAVSLCSLCLFRCLAPSFLLTASIPIMLTPLLSQFLHPFLHLPIADAVDVAPRITGWLLQTRYGQWARMSHFVHHRHVRYNFNLLPGGDYLMRTFKAPTEVEIAEMQSIGLVEKENRHGKRTKHCSQVWTCVRTSTPPQ